MTLAIVFKGPEGIVLAADSRVTLTVEMQDPSGNKMLTQAHYDSATKLLRVNGQSHVAAVTYGLGSLGTSSPRTAHSLIPEFETELAAANCGRLSVEAFAERMGDFFARQHAAQFNGAKTDDMVFLVGGFDEGEAYGRVYEVKVPSNPKPAEHNANDFGLTYGGQADIAYRCLNGLTIPYQFLPLQDCVDLAVVLIKTTAQLLQYTIGIRGVGGHIDVATVTRTKGYENVQVKQIRGAS